MTKPDKWTAVAAQLWCKPEHSKKEMDVDFAQSIAQALRDAEKAGMDAVEHLIKNCEGDLDYALFALSKLRAAKDENS
jgi:hypothetical protein